MNIIFHFLTIICIWKAEHKIILPFEILAKSTQGKKIMLEKFQSFLELDIQHHHIFIVCWKVWSVLDIIQVTRQKYDPRNTFKAIAIRWYTGGTRLCASIGKENFYEDYSVLPW